MLTVTPSISIPERELRITYSRSSGPGGQHVNKSNTKVTLRWNVAQSPAISDAVRERIMLQNAARLSSDGEIVLHCDSFRERPRNVEACRERLTQIVKKAARPPKRRKATKPSRAAVERRLTEKRRRAAKKAQRKDGKGDY